MKLEYLHDLTANGKFKDVVSENLIRLWDFSPQEAKQFQDLINDFVKNNYVTKLSLDQEEFIKSINCKLTLVKDEANNGINKLCEDEFICKLNNDGYKHMIELIKPFVNEDCNGYQWLDEQATTGNIDFLFSPGGTW